MCDLHPDYNPIGNDWNWGCALINVEKNGNFEVVNNKIYKLSEYLNLIISFCSINYIENKQKSRIIRNYILHIIIINYIKKE